MGLGPPVCVNCWVIKILPDESVYPQWTCPICGSTDTDMGLWECGKTDKELDDNLRFLKFMLNK
jgi:predicted RNA-binding Zn-ribbon protein involved in translation (DUF1610 family)